MAEKSAVKGDQVFINASGFPASEVFSYCCKPRLLWWIYSYNICSK
jgi:hypothetical protein